MLWAPWKKQMTYVKKIAFLCVFSYQLEYRQAMMFQRDERIQRSTIQPSAESSWRHIGRESPPGQPVRPCMYSLIFLFNNGHRSADVRTQKLIILHQITQKNI